MKRERCGKETNVTIMSMFNTDTICMDCKETERKRPDYRAARDAEIQAVRNGDYNFTGIGF